MEKQEIVAGCELLVAGKKLPRPLPLATSNQISAGSVESQPATSRSGFTLIELLISIAMVLVLIIGINFVFTKTTDAIGAGQTVNAFARESQSTQAILFDDFRNISKDPPCFVIGSQLVTQYLNAADAQNGSDPTVIQVDNQNTVTIGTAAGNLSPAILNYRNHRADLVKFFAHGNYQRRSANDGSYTSQTTSQDAFITLGHAMLPTKDGGSYVGPATDAPAAANHLVQDSSAGGLWQPLLKPTAGPQQRLGAYAADWVLARSAVLLKDQSTNVNTVPAFIESCYPRWPNPNPAFTFVASEIPYLANLTPLGYYSPDTNGANGTVIQSSRYDFANVTPDQFRRSIADEILQWRNANFFGGHLWWNPLVYNLAARERLIAAYGAAPYISSGTVPPTYNAASYFVNPVPAGPNAATPPQYDFGVYAHPVGTWPGAEADWSASPPSNVPDLARIACNPQIQAPLDSASIAQMAPYFLQHCSQFIVEYAGDYLTQAPTGELTTPGIGPDGQIDFVIDANGNKKIRWYGMPRSSNGGTPITYIAAPTGPFTIRGYNPNAGTLDNPTNPLVMQQFVDVIPLRDYYSMWFNRLNGDTLIYQPPWEVDLNFDSTADYAAPIANTNAAALNVKFNQTGTTPRYVAAWYNDMPAMIRILIKVDDTNDKLKDGPWYEYVFKLK